MKLTLKQKKLLELLSINCRFSNKDIGKSVGLSKDAVSYQIEKLIQKEKLAELSIQFDYRYLGYTHYHVLIRLKDLKFNTEELCKIKSLNSINSSYGKYDLQIIVLVKEKGELHAALKKIEKILNITNITVVEFDSFYKGFTNIIPPISVHAKIPKNAKNKVYDLNERIYGNIDKVLEFKLDKTDKKIIKQLLKNPRIKFTDIEKNTGLNHETIRYRINKYAKTKFIKKFGLLHDFKKYGLYTNYLLLKLKNVDRNKFKEYLEKNENIFYSAKLIGEYNCVVYILSNKPEELGTHLKEIRNLLKDSILEIDLLHLEKFYKYIQFPENEL